ncbi:MAG: hypothetical protein RL885_01945 [Planctomycetota bacterium]
MPILREIDRLLRGEATSAESLRGGHIDIQTRTLVQAAVGLGAIYGAFMGMYAAFGETLNFGQLFASMIKVPLLFLLTLVVTFPSLYVFSALANTRLAPRDTLRLLTASIAVTLTLLASFGPVTGFFTFSTNSYEFILLLNVLFFGVSGIAGLIFLKRCLDSLFRPPEPPKPEEPMPSASEQKESDEGEEPEVIVVPPGVQAYPRPQPPRESPYATIRRNAEAERARTIFRIWTVIYGAVGAQMGWILRPFIGSPELPFQIFREGRDSNFFEAVLRTLGELMQ